MAFRNVMRIKNVLECFTEFSFEDLPMDEQSFADFSSKYQDLRDKVIQDRAKEKVSILDDIDFEVELLTRDKINVSYIISLLRNLKNAEPAQRAKQRKAILDMLDSEVQLRSKRELIAKFIERHFDGISADANMGDEFDSYWESGMMLSALCSLRRNQS